MRVSIRLALPYLLLSLVVGVIAGFIVGQSPRSDPLAADATDSAADSDAQDTQPVDLDLEARPATIPQSPLGCSGQISAPEGYQAVVGVADVGAMKLAERLAVPPVSRTFQELNRPEVQAEVRTAALDAVKQGPVVLLLWNPGPYQRLLAHDVLTASPQSVALVVTKATPPLTAPEGFPPGAVSVSAAPNAPDPEPEPDWLAAVHDLVTGRAICPGG